MKQNKKFLTTAAIAACFAITGCTAPQSPAPPGPASGTSVPDDVISDPAPKDYNVDTPTTLLKQFPDTVNQKLKTEPNQHLRLPCLDNPVTLADEIPYTYLNANNTPENDTTQTSQARYLYVYGNRDIAHTTLDILNKTPTETEERQCETSSDKTTKFNKKATIKTSESITYPYVVTNTETKQQDLWLLTELNNVVFSEWYFNATPETIKNRETITQTNLTGLCYYKKENPCTAEEIPQMLPLAQ